MFQNNFRWFLTLCFAVLRWFKLTLFFTVNFAQIFQRFPNRQFSVLKFGPYTSRFHWLYFAGVFGHFKSSEQNFRTLKVCFSEHWISFKLTELTEGRRFKYPRKFKLFWVSIKPMKRNQLALPLQAKLKRVISTDATFTPTF